MTMKAIAILIIFFGVTFWLSPFPHWPTYFALWKNTLFNPDEAVHLRARLRQTTLLLRHLILCPLWTCLWGLDEVLFRGYRQQSVRPIFIIGQPRSGTTFLHRALATDEKQFCALRHIEWRLPFITVQKLIRLLGLEGWLQRRSYWPDTDAGRRAAQMHENTLYDWEEDGIFFEERFLLHYFVLFRFPYPDLLPDLDDFDRLPPSEQRRILGIHRRVIQKILYLNNKGGIYLSKEVESTAKLDAFAELYPDAVFIVLVRESSSFISSQLALIGASTASKIGVDVSRVRNWRIANLSKRKHNCRVLIDFLRRLPEERQMRFSFHQLVRHSAATVEHIYLRLGLGMGSSTFPDLRTIQRAQDGRTRAYHYHEVRFEGFEFYDAFVAGVDREHRDVLFVQGSPLIHRGDRSRS